MKSSARINKELKDLTDNPMEGVFIETKNEDDVSIWYATIDGPKDSPFENGKFKVEIDFTDNYPFKSPKVHFVTKIYHPNIKSDTGEICTAAIEKQWVPTLNAQFVIESVINLMAEPRPEDPLEQEIADQFMKDYDGYVESAQKHTAEFAG
uniref:E2 ubiquitin-conjugating enzyme n=1 Tax=Euplotes harpa TaxID=151035 RepID=A0A7S3JE16_9SPIT|mmetsp:Transcript_32418/g.36961  ORF Transcript_32418/g.36961 Transcript_32418/m.36961 type:complete len:151 (+) Transcript_32418:1-453(+)